MAKTLGYARISTDVGQDVASQKAALARLGAVVVFTETGTGSSLRGRDQLESAIRLLEPGDELLALHPDRIARDTADLLTVAKQVVERGVSCPLLSGPSTMTVWIEEGTTNASEEAQARGDHRQAA